MGLTNDTTRTFSGSLTEILSDLSLFQTVENLADEILSADARHGVASLHRPDAVYCTNMQHNILLAFDLNSNVKSIIVKLMGILTQSLIDIIPHLYEMFIWRM